jgi:hypothetical protein
VLPLPVRLDVPDAFRAKAWYALAELLRGLGRTPVEAGAEHPALVYGPAPVEGPLWVRYTAHTPTFFDTRRPSALHQPAAWLIREEGRIPVALGDAEHPDLIASAFLWLSGWSEHGRIGRDHHGRLPFGGSLAAQWGVPAALPVVDVYRTLLAEGLLRKGVEGVAVTGPVAGTAWAVCVTCDVDHVRYGRLRRAVRALQARDLFEARRALAAWPRPGRDPFRRALAHIADATAARGGQATFLFKAGATDPHDVPYRLGAPWLQKMAAGFRVAGHELGLHPGYGTPDRADLLAAEVQRFTAAFGRAPVSVRQHYLRHAGPSTARLHAAAGLRVDNTLGWAEAAGFRNGTCRPFRPFDPDADAPLPLTEIPLAWMDTGAFGTRGLDLDGAWAETFPLLDAARRHGGVFAGLWHNTFHASTDPAAQHLARTLDYAVQQWATILPLSTLALPA